MNAATVAVIAGRMLGRPLVKRRLLVIPGLLALGGLAQLGDIRFTALAIVLLVVQMAVSLGLGALRGWTIHLYEREGHLWMRYRWTTVALWVLAIVLRLGFVAGGAMMGAATAGSG